LNLCLKALYRCLDLFRPPCRARIWLTCIGLSGIAFGSYLTRQSSQRVAVTAYGGLAVWALLR
jgi:hypothetical protein